MTTLRYFVVVGMVGFLSAATEDEFPAKGSAVPVDGDDNHDYVAKALQFGYPSNDSIRFRKSFVFSYDPRHRVPNWVMEHLTPSLIEFNEKVSREDSEFFEDESIHPFFRSTNSDYKGSGYDRGHLAPAGDHRSEQEFLDDTFVLSNMAPQVGVGFNRHAWSKLEKHVRNLVKEYDHLYVCTGPLYLPKSSRDGKKYVKYEVIGSNNVAVPTHFYKVIVGETEDHEFDLKSYLLPNKRIENSVPLKSFLVPKETIEKAAGFLLFEKLPEDKFRNIN